MGAREQVERFFIPEIDACLKADGHWTVRELFQQLADLLAYAEDLVDEVDVVDAARDQLVDLRQHGR